MSLALRVWLCLLVVLLTSLLWDFDCFTWVLGLRLTFIWFEKYWLFCVAAYTLVVGVGNATFVFVVW